MELLQETLKRIRPVESNHNEAFKRWDNLAIPKGSLGRLEELAKKVVSITNNQRPELKKKVIFTMAGDHGVADLGVSAFPKEVTSQMLCNFAKGGAAINILARHIGAKVVVVDMGVAEDIKLHPDIKNKKIGYGTADFSKGPAMSKEEAVLSIERGIESFEEEYKKGIDIVGTGDMGIGNTTPSSAITAVIAKKAVRVVTGRGTGINDLELEKKIDVIGKGIMVNLPDPSDGIDVLSKVGGYEIGGIAGVIIAACARRVPIVVDGFISTAAALIASKLKDEVRGYLFAGHSSVEVGHKTALRKLKLLPIVDLNLRLGEGTGAALAMGIIEASCKVLNEVLTFKEAGVSKSKK
ncbi:MAG: nicotinate-nucleotide--dimethylbenzimidazole phosphoribosyltransferase [bacterium]|nr:nicotinate-nucleotide--dimethylbenzimidazole phosphoribosyltransferase [bacterium]